MTEDVGTLIARLREIKDRCESATAGPWINHSGDTEDIHPRVYSPDKLVAEFGNAESWLDAGDEWEANASFCAHARDDIPWLLSEVERLREAVTAALEARRQAP